MIDSSSWVHTGSWFSKSWTSVNPRTRIRFTLVHNLHWFMIDSISNSWVHTGSWFTLVHDSHWFMIHTGSWLILVHGFTLVHDLHWFVIHTSFTCSWQVTEHKGRILNYSLSYIVILLIFYDNICETLYSPQIPYGAHISKSCRSFLLRLLQRDPDQRMTYEEFFSHRFLDLDHLPSADSLQMAVGHTFQIFRS